MKAPIRRDVILAAVLTSLYPAEFRAEFGEEMQAVFNQAMAEARSDGPWALLRVLLRELADLPVNLLREHLRGLVRKELWIMNRLSPSSQSRAGLLGMLGFGIGFALLGLVFCTAIVTQPHWGIPSLVSILIWTATGFLAGSLGGASLGYGIHPGKTRAYAWMGGTALALANLAGMLISWLGAPLYFLKLVDAQYQFGINLFSLLLIGPLLGLGLGLAEQNLRYGVRLSAVGLIAFFLGLLVSGFASGVNIGHSTPGMGIYTGLSGDVLPPHTFSIVFWGVILMAILGAIDGLILGRGMAEDQKANHRSLFSR